METREMSGRKRPAKGEEDGRKARVRSDGVGAATDAEVEEFFAILRRMHAAAKYLGKGKTSLQAGDLIITSSNKGSSVRDPEWRPIFKTEDFEGGMVFRSEQQGSAVSGVAGRGVAALGGVGTEGERPEKGSLDLNTEPEPEARPS